MNAEATTHTDEVKPEEQAAEPTAEIPAEPTPEAPVEEGAKSE